MPDDHSTSAAGPEVKAMRAELARLTRLLAIPLDLKSLFEDGVLGGANRGGWFEVLDLDRLPPEARMRLYQVKQVVKGGETRVYLKFEKPSKAAAKLHRKLTGKRPDEG